MYVTRPLSLYKRSPEAADEVPPAGPGSGFLVIQDEEYESQATCCFGLCRNVSLRDLPFPQDRRLTAQVTKYGGEGTRTSSRRYYFIPVMGQPLSSNRYHVVVAQGKYKGMISTCSTEEDKITCCFCRCVRDVKPREFIAGDIYQQLEISILQSCCNPSRGYFLAKSVSPDGFPQEFLRQEPWTMYGSTTHVYPLTEASGIDPSLRARMPDVSFSNGASVVIGKWYCPFVFVKEDGIPPRDQVKRDGYYEMTLEQFWEQIHSCVSYDGPKARTVKVSTTIQVKIPYLHEIDGAQKLEAAEQSTADGIKWFKPVKGQGRGVGLSSVIVDRMRWEEERAGWSEENVSVEKEEEFHGEYWTKFSCFVLVERFSLKRLDGTLLLTCEFKHADKLTCTWD